MTLLLKNLLFTALVPGTVAVWVPLWISRGHSYAGGSVLAGAVLLLGAAIYAWCVWDFATFGRGTPAPIDAPQKLVVRGLYHYTRNPMYVGVLTVILGWSVLFRSAVLVLYAAGVAACFHLFVVLYEERHLAREFGSEYGAYLSRVPRWLPFRRRCRDGAGDILRRMAKQAMPEVKTAAPQFLVDSLSDSLDFYRERLGFTVDFVYDDFYASVSRNGVPIHLKRAPKLDAERTHRQAHDHVDAHLDVSGVRELCDELTRRGAPITRALEKKPWNVMDFYVQDPDGYILCFSEGV